MAPGTERGLRPGSLPPPRPLGGPSQLQSQSFGGRKQTAFTLPSPPTLPGGRGASQAPLPHLNRHFSSSAGAGLGPWLPRLSSSRHKGGVPASWRGLHRRRPPLRSRGQLRAGIAGNPRVPRGARVPSPRAPGGPRRTPPEPGPATPGRAGTGRGSAGWSPPRRDLGGLARASAPQPRRRCRELADAAAAADRSRAAPQPAPRRFLLSLPAFGVPGGARERPLRSPHAAVFKPRLYRSALAPTAHLHPRISARAIHCPGGERQRGGRERCPSALQSP